MSKIKVLVVDDSAFMRKAIESMLKKDPEIEIVGFAKNGIEALEQHQKLNPDCITLDIEMPMMDGITALKKIMSTKPVPVIMVSSLTTEGADATLQALEHGAVDFIAKGKSFASFGVLKIEDDLRSKIKLFARKKGIFRKPTPIQQRPQAGAPRPQAAPRAETQKVMSRKTGPKKAIIIGTSTGGPQSLQKVIPMLPADIGIPIIVVQHMPPNFTKSLAQRLNTLSKLTVIEAQGKERLEPNMVYIAKGGVHLKVKKQGATYILETSPEPSNVLHIPSVDVTAASVAEAFGAQAMGVIMTGMGSDGVKGLQQLKQRGGTILAQNEESCVVYGMPRAVVDAKIADEIISLGDIHSRIMFHLR